MSHNLPETMPSQAIHYSDSGYLSLQARLDSFIALAAKRPAGASAGGVGTEALKKFLRSVYVRKNREIRNQDFLKLNPATLAEDYLLPRRDLSFFILDNWLRHVFLASLRPETAHGMLVFGLGRLFSSYNDTGVQRSTDADINIIVRDDMSPARRAEIAEKLALTRKELLENFRISLEVNESFTILRLKDVQKRLASANADTRLRNLLFYKSICGSFWLIKDEEMLRSAVFSPIQRLPDVFLFENFLGLANPGTTFTRLLSGHVRLRIIADGSRERVEVSTIIGSRAFAQRWRRRFAPSLCISPPEWHFSMKFLVNRVYDYVCAMRHRGYSLEEIGFSEVSSELGADPDYLFLRNAHRLMLYLQELEELVMRSFSLEVDYSYVSRSRFMRFMEIDGDAFKRNFVDMAMKGGLLVESEKRAFRVLKRKIETKARDRYAMGRTGELKLLPPDFRFETVFKDKTDFKIRVPYSWSDLGYFVFDSVASRMTRVVLGKIVPTLVGYGMPAGEYRRYLGLAAEVLPESCPDPARGDAS